MISARTYKNIERKNAFHKDCYAHGRRSVHERNNVGLVRQLFDMVICDSCHKTLDDDSQITIRTAIWSLSRNKK